MKMLRHDDVPEDAELQFDSSFLEQRQKEIAGCGAIENWQSVVAATGDEVETVVAVVSCETERHR
jgi:hypothetical protein